MDADRVIDNIYMNKNRIDDMRSYNLVIVMIMNLIIFVCLMVDILKHL